MHPNFRSNRKYLGPPWLTTNGESGLVGYVSDAFKDGWIERLRLGLLARFPQQDPTGTPAADDALAAMGRDRRIIRGINEPSANYAARLVRWIDDWRAAGNALALLKQLAAYTGPGPAFRTVDVRGNWYSLNADGSSSVLMSQSNWDWDNDPNALNRWARFWVVIYPNGLWQPGPTWGSPGALWGDGRTWGTTATPAQVASVRGIVADWKPAGTTCVNIIIAFDSTSFNPSTSRDGAGLPSGHWSTWSYVSGGAQVPSRLSTARYWDGV